MLRSAPKERVSKHGNRDSSFETPPSAAPQDEGLHLNRGDYWPQTLDPVVQTTGTTTPVKQVV
jgi:hypothetical protein